MKSTITFLAVMSLPIVGFAQNNGGNGANGANANVPTLILSKLRVGQFGILPTSALGLNGQNGQNGQNGGVGGVGGATGAGGTVSYEVILVVNATDVIVRPLAFRSAPATNLNGLNGQVGGQAGGQVGGQANGQTTVTKPPGTPINRTPASLRPGLGRPLYLKNVPSVGLRPGDPITLGQTFVVTGTHLVSNAKGGTYPIYMLQAE